VLKCRSYPIGFVLLSMLLIATPDTANAQQSRTRTLTYDPDRKTWAEAPPPPPGTAEGDLHAVRAQIEEGKYRPALSAIKEFVERYGESDPLYPQVKIAKAEALVGQCEYYKAHETLQEFLSEFGGMAPTSEALRLEFTIAEAYLRGAKRKILGLRVLSGEDIAFQILDEIAADYPDSRLAELATKTKADHLFDNGEHTLAELEYARLLREYPQSRYYPFALRRSAEAALTSFAGVDYDEAAIIEAAERYREYRLRYTHQADREGVGNILDSIREMRAEKDFAVGAYYERTDHLSSAIFYYRLVCEDWLDTIGATKAAARLELLGASEPINTNEVSDK